jgi:hypothetical protein
MLQASLILINRPYSFNFVNLSKLSSWLRHHATNRKIAGEIPNDVIGFFSLPNPSSSTMTLGSTLRNRNEYQVVSWKGGGKWWQARKAENLTAICEPIHLEHVGASNTQHYGPSRPVTRRALISFNLIKTYLKITLVL